MVEPAGDREFLRSIFLMEAWDTLGALDEGLGRLTVGAEPAWDDLLLVAHRLRGAAALQGFTGVAAEADAIEQVLDRLRATPTAGRAAGVAETAARVTSVKAALDAIERGVEPPPALPPTPPPAPAADDPLRAKLVAFFTSSDDVLSYFGPEALEHLDAMTAALVALEREGDDTASLDALFRAVHTLKGAAYVVGCRPIGELAHGLEDVLVTVREARASLTPAVVDAGLAAVDCFKHMLDATGDPSVDLTGTVAGLRGRLATLLQPAADDVIAAPTSPAPHAAPAAAAIERVTPAAPERTPAVPVAATAPTVSRQTPRPSVAAAARSGRQTIRVALERLDGLMDLVGELVVARSALERRVAELDRLGDVLFTSRARLGQSVIDFERGHLEERAPMRRGDARAGRDRHDRHRSVSELFAELEFDRYDDVTLFARGVAEIASDIAEAHAELASLARTVREDVGLVHRLTGEVRAGLGRARLVPIGSLYTRFIRQGQEAARANGKSVRIETRGESVELDASIIEQVVDPLLHLVQNAVVHGVESPDERRALGKPVAGAVTLSASHRGAFVVIEVADDGRGIDADRLRRRAAARNFVRAEVAATMSDRDALELIFRPGFSTAAEVTTTAGRGVGLDVVRTNIGRLNGEIAVETELGAGTRFTLRLPLTVLITEALLVRAGTEVLAVPLNAVHVIAPADPDARRTGPDGERVLVEERWLPLIHLDRALGVPPLEAPERPAVLVLRGGGGLFACVVDEVLHKEEIVVKPLGGYLDGIGPYSGATVSADGRITLLLDAPALSERALRPAPGRREAAGPSSLDAPLALEGPATPRQPSVGDAGARGRVLLVDDSLSVRKFVGQMLAKAGFDVTTATDGADALSRLGEAEFDVLVTDLEMPRLNGYELLEDVRRRPATRALPVVILTTRAGDKHRTLAERLGVNHYVIKPVAEQAFVRLVESLVTRGAEQPS